MGVDGNAPRAACRSVVRYGKVPGGEVDGARIGSRVRVVQRCDRRRATVCIFEYLMPTVVGDKDVAGSVGAEEG